MPYLDAEAAALQRVFAIADEDLPDAAVLVGQWDQGSYFEGVRRTWPDVREIEGHSILINEGGPRIWISVVFGGAMAATMAHLAVKLCARTVVQVGSIGGLTDSGQVGDVLVPGLVVGRDGVSRQLSRNRTVVPDEALSAALREELDARLDGGSVRSGTVVSTTTISLERQIDVARWRRAGYAGVEMECAATVGTASYFGAASAAAFVLMDNLARRHTVFVLSDEDRRRIRAGKDAILQAAVAVIVRTFSQDSREP